MEFEKAERSVIDLSKQLAASETRLSQKDKVIKVLQEKVNSRYLHDQ